MTFDGKANRLLLFEPGRDKLIAVAAGADGFLGPDRMTQIDARYFGVWDPRGMTIDPLSGHLFMLDGLGARIVRIEPDPALGFARATIGEIGFEPVGLAGFELRGIALDPATGHLHILSPERQRLYEVTDTGLVVANRDLSGIGLVDPQAIVFAPSGDMTDDPSVMSLYVADGGGTARTGSAQGGIIELSLTATLAATSTDVGTLIQTIDAWQFRPPSPDSSGLTYQPSSDTILMSDSEVNEIPKLFTGDNLFELSSGGTLLDTSSTISYSDEPTGLAHDPFDGRLFISDDTGTRGVHIVDPGPDGVRDTADDAVTFLETGDFKSSDPEGVAFDPLRGLLYVVDGVNSEVYEVDPGPNGIFDGVRPAGDDQVASFDTARLGVTDPEGIAFDTDSNSLYIIGKPTDLLAQVSTSGSLMRMIDVSAAAARKPAGLAYAPGSLTPSYMNIYIADRGVDNNSDSKENDGKIYEISASLVSPDNAPPTVDAGPDQSITLPATASLDGTTSDDGIPGPLTTTWSHVGGLGTVTFADAGAVDTTASFSAGGTYDLRLTASDGELSSSDYINITVFGTGGNMVVESRVSAGSDDAEEQIDGLVDLGSSDLELVNVSAGDQTVGMRFNGVAVPQGSTIASAFIQFKADEAHSVGTILTIEGQDTDNAPTFISSTGNISSRARTAASASWSPVPWTVVGEAGPDQLTPDIAPIIQEIVNRPGWSSGSSLVIIVSGTGKRVAESYNGDVNGAPLLHVEIGPAQGNTAPVVTITAPADGTSVDEGTSITFAGAASDAEDGDLTGLLIWTSSLDGAIGSGGSFSTASLSPGTHTVTAAASDGEGLAGSAQIMVTVTGNAAPVVAITAPANGSFFVTGQTVTFSGTASDAEDGDLTAGLAWRSDLDGPLGTGGSVSTATLSEGTHTVTAETTDSMGLADSAQVGVTVTGNTVQVTSPSGSSGYRTTGGRNRDKHLIVVVTLAYESGPPVEGGTVSVSITGPKSITDTGVTDSLGQATFRIGNAPPGDYMTTITEVIAAGLAWDGITPENSFTK
jgi:uncharacterized protein YjiK